MSSIENHLYAKIMDYSEGQFFVIDPSHQFEELQNQGFLYNHARGHWQTKDMQKAKALGKQGTPKAKSVLRRYFIETMPVDTKGLGSPEGFLPTDWQIEAALFALGRNRSYLALDPRLGKSVASVLCYNHSPGLTLVVCPSFLKRNWVREILKWNTHRLTEADIFVVEKKTDLLQFNPMFQHFLIMPDSLVAALEPALQKRDIKFKWAFIDEAHRFKNSNAQRTQAVYGGFKHVSGGKRKFVRGLESLAERVVSLSGTHMPSRPIEIWSTLYSQCAGNIGFLSYFDFGMRYCGGYHDGFGYRFDGNSKLEELHGLIYGKYLLKMEARDYINMPKVYENVYLDRKLNKGDTEKDRELSTDFRGKMELKDYAKHRRFLGLEKVEPALEILTSILEETEEKVVIFAWHLEVIDQLRSGLTAKGFETFAITGETKNRDEINQDFQNSKRRAIILNIAAGGVGLDLSKAHRVIFVEFDWVPGNNRQAEDRALNIKKNDSTLIQYLILPNTLDEKIWDSVQDKETTIQKLNKGE